MKVLQINTVVNSGSTGRIAEDIGKVLISNGHESYIAFGRGNHSSISKTIKIGSKFDFYLHVLKSLLTDRHGFGSKKATKKLLQQIDLIRPDIIGLHNIHGYYINIEILFNYLNEKNIPVLWTFHDCWPFTGHCTYNTDCENCQRCQFKYPMSILINQSSKNFNDKNYIFNQITNLQIISPSIWLKNMIKQSFLKHPVRVINNGIDINLFKPLKNSNLLSKNPNFEGKKIILGVANIWDKRKGLSDFIRLSSLLDSTYQIVLIGLSNSQIAKLPSNVVGINRTTNISELVDYYNLANVYVNPTYKDNFPTTNIEALACGTPVITYDTGGSPEAINMDSGLIIAKGDILGLSKAIKLLCLKPKDDFRKNCRQRAINLFNKDDRFKDYLKIYEELLKNS